MSSLFGRMQRKRLRGERRSGRTNGVDFSQARNLPRFVEAQRLHVLGDYDAAWAICHQLDSDAEPHFEARYLAAIIAHDAFNTSEAIRLLHEVVAARPTWTEAHYNLGVFYEEMGEGRVAMAWYERAIALTPNFVPVLIDMARMEWAYGARESALERFETAITHQREWPEAAMNSAAPHFFLNRLRDGWTCYEQRWNVAGFKVKNAQRDTTAPAWKGEPLGGQRLLVFHEQGFGDSIMMLRYLRPLVEEKGATLLLKVPTNLLGLVEANAPPGSIVVPLESTILPPHAAMVPLMSLPYHFDTEHDTIPGAEGYLEPRWQEIPGTEWMEPRARRVGLCWAGVPTHKNDRNRSMSPAILADLLRANPRIDWRSFQIGPRSAECHELGLEKPDWITFEDSAHRLSQIDLLITVDTATAHLAGALGVPTWLCIPAVPEMRWPLEGERTPWYHSIRIFRQPLLGDWRSVMTQLHGALNAD